MSTTNKVETDSGYEKLASYDNSFSKKIVFSGSADTSVAKVFQQAHLQASSSLNTTTKIEDIINLPDSNPQKKDLIQKYQDSKITFVSKKVDNEGKEVFKDNPAYYSSESVAEKAVRNDFANKSAVFSYDDKGNNDKYLYNVIQVGGNGSETNSILLGMNASTMVKKEDQENKQVQSKDDILQGLKERYQKEFYNARETWCSSGRSLNTSQYMNWNILYRGSYFSPLDTFGGDKNLLNIVPYYQGWGSPTPNFGLSEFEKLVEQYKKIQSQDDNVQVFSSEKDYSNRQVEDYVNLTTMKVYDSKKIDDASYLGQISQEEIIK